MSSPLVDAGQPALLHAHLRAGERVHGHREVGVVAHEQHVVAQPGGQRLGVEGPAGQLRLELGLDAELLAGQPRGLRGPHLRARQAGVQLTPSACERPPAAARLLASLPR